MVANRYSFNPTPNNQKNGTPKEKKHEHQPDKKGLCEKANFESDTIKTLENLHLALIDKDKRVCSLKGALRVLKLIDKGKKEQK